MWMCWPSHMEERTVAGVSLDRGTVQPRQEGGEEACGGMRGWISSGFRIGHLVVTRVFPMSGCTWECSWCVANIPGFTAAKAVKLGQGSKNIGQGTGLWGCQQLWFQMDLTLKCKMGKQETPELLHNLWHDQGKLGYQGRGTASVQTRVESTRPAS